MKPKAINNIDRYRQKWPINDILWSEKWSVCSVRYIGFLLCHVKLIQTKDWLNGAVSFCSMQTMANNNPTACTSIYRYMYFGHSRVKITSERRRAADSVCVTFYILVCLFQLYAKEVFNFCAFAQTDQFLPRFPLDFVHSFRNNIYKESSHWIDFLFSISLKSFSTTNILDDRKSHFTIGLSPRNSWIRQKP